MALPFNITPASVLSDVALALGLANIGVNIDVVGIYDSKTLRQIFAEGRPLKAFVRETSRVMDHPVETGSLLSDHHIILPVQIEMMLSIPAHFFSSTYQQIKTAFINATPLSVQTKTGVYTNMIVAEMPHDEDPDKYDSIIMGVKFREVQFTVPASIAQPNAPANYSPTNPQNQNTAIRGQQSQLLVTLPAAALSYIQAAYAWGR